MNDDHFIIGLGLACLRFDKEASAIGMAGNAVLRCNCRNSIVKPIGWAFLRVYSDLVASFANGSAIFFDDCHGNGLWLDLNAP